jgi:hypothetical protein
MVAKTVGNNSMICVSSALASVGAVPMFHGFVNLSNEQIGTELDLSSGDAREMSSCLRQGVVDKKVSATKR